ncbi:hypothetical protein CcaverHIS002_0505210 [Cutaneotrichosporon cavernicola]|uniref:NADH dehydrogenase [ubiquinone] 1 beta subcomplex subunit 7 n=1 Tax=Cutaneotrichosporon cavernicola TaxID=279322 RepID=A0AA48L6R4_9TREE|nr:uncharacterized protein CcaverHIS019_0505730 [Cutaneotrichosporon cavernicola]BEI85120.1 hypothetical protein CcaverHIS002_0505210 [Cutaneotrichosporon cavernicola]BEI92945.1 hypothetical protein CcaverHIS019_0505730 [Cutaneotrichosporon cavernicola]BEJ00721.1 hypothetical protein CcaverHIS631_0505780 [Cutaneotrichosporon cavernicola]BEJ08488.1 hypothetical protein CcaverHIS641_0505820 [Cutaneotrichosporon cavernicola]
MAASTTASETEMKANRLPLGWRDQCSSLLIPLNICRHKNDYLTWKCDDERHSYEKCQYDDYVRRMKDLVKQKREADE